MKMKAPLTLEQATKKAAPYVRHKKKLLWLLEKATRNHSNATNFFLPLGKTGKYFFVSFVPISRASFARPPARFSASSPLSSTL